MSSLSGEETLSKYERLMGAELGKSFYAIFCDVTWLHKKWDGYKILYGSQESVDVLNSTAASGFFGRQQRVLRDDIVLHIARLADPEKSCGRETMSIRNLIAQIVVPEITPPLHTHLKEFLDRAKFARNRRNLVYAHPDKDVATGSANARSLEAASMKNIEQAVDSIVTLVNIISGHYNQSEIGFLKGAVRP